jgi:hypothetical protein
MHHFRRTLTAWLALAGLLGAMLAPAAASADPLRDWTPGPDGVGDNTYTGFIDMPSAGATVPLGLFNVSGWFVDTQAQGWSGADDIQIWQGTMDGGGKLLTKAAIGGNRPDVAAALGSPFWAASGFGAVIPPDLLSAGAQTLSVYAHTPGKGWWYKQVQLNVSASAPNSANIARASQPAGAPAPIGAGQPVISGATLPIILIEHPTSSENIKTRTTDYQIIGYALDRAAMNGQGSQNTGINQVDVYMDAEPENGGSFLGNADLGFSDDAAASAYGPQFQAAGWRLTFKPTLFHNGQHTLFAYAHSAVTGKTNLATQSLNIQEN